MSAYSRIYSIRFIDIVSKEGHMSHSWGRQCVKGSQNEVQMVYVLIVVCACLFLLALSKRESGFAHIYRVRACQGRSWRRAFPSASKRELRSFLLLFTSAFAFKDQDKLKFRPDDGILDIYRNIYPSRWTPDVLEVETLAAHLHKRHAIELGTVWKDDLTLGELFSHIQSTHSRGI